MIWTAIFENQEILVFSTQYNSYDEAKDKARGLCGIRPIALIKGNHPDIRFF